MVWLDHLFFHCQVALRLWHRQFRHVEMDWVPLTSLINHEHNDHWVLGIWSPSQSFSCIDLGDLTWDKCQNFLGHKDLWRQHLSFNNKYILWNPIELDFARLEPCMFILEELSKIQAKWKPPQVGNLKLNIGGFSLDNSS